jgi:hypothetical protein
VGRRALLAIGERARETRFAAKEGDAPEGHGSARVGARVGWHMLLTFTTYHPHRLSPGGGVLTGRLGFS